ncbi:hypothetical protein CANARDRAFT_29641 [[Candida] arabinofermentans NRRL YB-2248]|uniref:Uncharacterized protein n=1 Tax=[Candida] arabinofermentans NRRL YB-2248 TaxID=983967 RepID=A0A1E4SWP4_9ASCO|nr:hypothetical protein CANARDRAFT_29641 [[Candida] arabinofermentans NRRL YB-2248]
MRLSATPSRSLRLLPLQHKRFQTTKTFEPSIVDKHVEEPALTEKKEQLENIILGRPAEGHEEETRLQTIRDKLDLLAELNKTTKGEFQQLLNSAPKPTLHRDEIVLSKFKKLFKTYMERDKIDRQFTSSSSLLSQFPNLVPTPITEPYSKAELTIRQKHHESTSGSLGSVIKNVYKPHELITNPPRPNEVTVQKLMAAGCHLGHSTKLWKHSTQQFIYGEYKDIHIIDLDQTINYLKRAANIVTGVVENGGSVLFLGLKQGQLRSVQTAAKRCNGYYVTNRWVPGTITNSVDNPRPRHEIDMGDLPTGRKLNQGEEKMVVKPDLMVVLNPLDGKVAISEANQARVPTIGLIDTNCDPDSVTYGIPCNDDSVRATNLICGVLGRAGEIGLQRRLAKVEAYKKSLGLSSTEPLNMEGLEEDAPGEFI